MLQVFPLQSSRQSFRCSNIAAGPGGSSHLTLGTDRLDDPAEMAPGSSLSLFSHAFCVLHPQFFSDAITVSARTYIQFNASLSVCVSRMGYFQTGAKNAPCHYGKGKRSWKTAATCAILALFTLLQASSAFNYFFNLLHLWGCPSMIANWCSPPPPTPHSPSFLRHSGVLQHRCGIKGER